MGNKYLGKTCPFCHTPIKNDDVIAVCDICDMPHHLSCWQENRSCSTFGCTGKIKKIIGDQPPQEPKPMAKQEPEAPAAPVGETLYCSKTATLYANNTLAAESIVLTREAGELHACCSFRALTDEPIHALLVDVQCKDVWGNALEGVSAFQYLDLKTQRGSVFGQAEQIPIPDKNTRSVSVLVKKILFANGTIMDCGEQTGTFPAAVTLADHLGSQELAQEYVRQTNTKAHYAPVAENGFWRCACGSLNPEAEEVCPVCGSASALLLSALDASALQESMNAYRQRLREQQAQAQAQQEERIRRAEEQVKAEQEQREQHQKLHDELEQKQKKSDRIRRSILLTLLGLVIAACLVVFLVMPGIRYLDALNALDDDRFEEAYAGFIELGNFLNSPSMAQEAMYQKAASLFEDENFSAAGAIYKQLGDYKDAKACVLECDYQRAIAMSNSKNYAGAYKVFIQLGDYKDTADRIPATLLLWQASAMASSNVYDAQNFSTLVELTPDHYQMFYSTILLFIAGHEDDEYWFDWGGTVAAQNTLTMLEMLPVTYEDTDLLLDLFRALTSTTQYTDLFRDHEMTMRQCWSLAFVQNLAKNDDALAIFLEGYWTGSGYYLNFYENEENGTTWSNYDLPWTAKPYGTKYYDIKDLVYVWIDKDYNELAKVFRFTIINYDTIQVFCYKNNREYTMYR